jgi:hypothetical protein
VNHCDERQRSTGLVSLQVPDQMPMDWACDLGGSFGELLRPVLRQLVLAEFNERLNPLRSSHLRHSDESGACGISPDATTRRRHPIQNGPAIGREAVVNGGAHG